MTEVPNDERGRERAERGFFGRLTDPIGGRVKREVNHLEERLQAFVQAQADKVKSTVNDKVAEYAPSVRAFGIAAVLGWLGVLTLVATAVLGLATAVPAWLAALIVAVVLLGTAGALAAYGKSHLPKPDPEAARIAAVAKAEEKSDVDHFWTD